LVQCALRAQLIRRRAKALRFCNLGISEDRLLLLDPVTDVRCAGGHHAHARSPRWTASR